jgi:hypothetical protein
MTGWPTQMSFSRAAKVGDNDATPSETEKISCYGLNLTKKPTK